MLAERSSCPSTPHRSQTVKPTKQAMGNPTFPVVSMAALQRVIAGERAVTTVSQLLD